MSERKYICSTFANGGMLKFGKALPLEQIEFILIQKMKEAGLDPAVTHAYENTLLWMTKNNKRSFTRAQQAIWDRAVLSYETALRRNN